MPSFFGEGNQPRVKDTRWRILQKILGATIDNGSGGGGGGGFAWITWQDTGPNPSGPPSDATKAGMVRFRDGNPPVVWDPAIPGWV